MTQRRSLRAPAPSADEVRQWLAPELAPAFAGAADVVVTGPHYEGSHSCVFRATGRSLPFPVAVKQCRDPSSGTPATEEAEHQFAALQAVTRALPGAAPPVPEPVLLIRDRAIVVSAWVDGPTIGALCQDWRQPTARLVDAVRRSGVWLRDFHAARAAEPAPLDTRAMLQLAHEAAAEAGPSWSNRPAPVAALRLLEETRPHVAAVAVPRSWMHGDCKPDNLVLVGERIVGLDAAARFVNTVLLDVAYFLAHLDLHLLHPGAWLGARRKPALEAFWTGYDPGRCVAPLPTAWMKLATVVRLHALRASTPPSLRQRYVRWCFDRLLERELRALAALTR